MMEIGVEVCVPCSMRRLLGTWDRAHRPSVVSLSTRIIRFTRKTPVPLTSNRHASPRGTGGPPQRRPPATDNGNPWGCSFSGGDARTREHDSPGAEQLGRGGRCDFVQHLHQDLAHAGCRRAVCATGFESSATTARPSASVCDGGLRTTSCDTPLRDAQGARVPPPAAMSGFVVGIIWFSYSRLHGVEIRLVHASLPGLVCRSPVVVVVAL